MAIKSRTASVLDRLKNRAKKEGIPFQIALQLFAQEEFLRRLSASDYAENLILKGGMFIYTLTEFDSRPTRDIDFLLRRLHGDLENIQAVMEEICRIETGNDFITVSVLRTEQISIDKLYPGVKTSFLAGIGNIRIPFSIDIGIDDIIVPGPVRRKIATRLPDFEQPDIYTYSLESTVAEKLDAILQRMEATSRMKDFYDIYYLSGMFDFSGVSLTQALRSTLKHRNRILTPEAFDEIAEFTDSPALNIQWEHFSPAKEASLNFAEVLKRIDLFLRPVYVSVLVGTNPGEKWCCKTLSWSGPAESKA